MRLLRIALGIIILISISISIYSSFLTFPNTYISSINVSARKEKDIDRLLQSLSEQLINIQIKDRNYTYSYKDLGIYFDKKKTKELVFQSRQIPFPLGIFSFFSSLLVKRQYYPVLEFSQDYYLFTSTTVFDVGQFKDSVATDDLNKRLSYKLNEEKYIIDTNSLKTLIVSYFGKNNQPVKPLLHDVPSTTAQTIDTENKKLDAVFEKPVTLIIQNNGNEKSTTLLPEALKKITTLQYSNNGISLNINEEKIGPVLNNVLTYNYESEDKRVSFSKLKTDLASLIDQRSKGIDSNSIIVKTDYNSNSNGNLADKYIEIDISQQRMYLFQDGQLFQTHRISSGKYYPTPIGTFKIMNKATNAYSNIYNVWMPYWMAFYYSPSLNAYFGIHELPYWLTNDGQKKQRPRENIGIPSTGGCISLDINESKEVYDFADINMPVYVFE